MAKVRYVIGFERNPAVLELLQEQYSQRREIDRDLGIDCTVRFFTLDYAGSDSNRSSIQYDYGSFSEVQEAQDKRLADPRWLLHRRNQESFALSKGEAIPTGKQRHPLRRQCLLRTS